MKRLILTLAAILAIGLVAVGLLADARANECRAAIVDGQGPIASALILAAMDSAVPSAAEKAMTLSEVPALLRPLARPLFVADRYCAGARGMGK